MSEYWKSTPKYWCKHCSIFVRDTGLERANHESTGKHQSAIKRSLRDLHRSADQKERDKERAKREVDRLNGVVSGSGSGSGSGIPAKSAPKPSGGAYGTPPQQISQLDRHRQLEQLAELGVAIPTEMRGEMAMAGEWTVTSTRVVEDSDKDMETTGTKKVKTEKDTQEESGADSKPEAAERKIPPPIKQEPEEETRLGALSATASESGTMVGHTFGSFLVAYRRGRDEKYKLIREALRDGTNGDAPIPASWPAGRSILTALPTELILLVCYRLYQADLLHLAQSCRSLTNVALDVLYARDVSQFDCLSVRWACALGVVPALERAFRHGASPNHEFGPFSHFMCKWPSCDTPLATAIVANQIGIIDCLINHGVDTNWAGLYATPDDYNSIHDCMFPMHWAMGAPGLLPNSPHVPGNVEVLRRLLDAGADPNIETLPRSDSSRPRGFTPLLMAMQPTVSVETVELLLERGAKPTQIGTYLGVGKINVRGALTLVIGRTHWKDLPPLGVMLFCHAVGNPYFRLDLGKARLLLMHGATLDIAFYSYSRGNPYTDDSWVYSRGSRTLGGAVNAYHSGPNLPIPPFLAVLWWVEEIIWWIENPENHSEPEHDKGRREQCCETILYGSQLITLLATATGSQQHDGERVPIPALIDATITDSSNTVFIPPRINGQTALRFVCRDFDYPETPDVIRALLHAGADMNAPDPHGCTALHRASMLGPAARVQELVTFRGGPSESALVVDARDNTGWTALHYACLFYVWDKADDQVSTVRLLLEAGAEVRSRTNAGWTPLSLAALGAHYKVVRLLLDAGAQADDMFRPVPTPTALADGTTERALVPIGRLVFDSHCWYTSSSGIVFTNPFGSRFPHETLPDEIEAALTTSKREIALQLRSRLGIAIPAPKNDTTLDGPTTLRGSSSPAPPHLPWPIFGLRRLSGRPPPKFAVEAQSEPFGVPDIPFVDFVGAEFEKDIDGVLDQLDAHGLLAMAVAVSRPERFLEALCWRDPSQGVSEGV
ncbi:uncharacterized protein C8A04DRAFT_34098 [Dichotomopilus funicola]|uniref:F-box domain-containing protein n=1 Tax=Dichotomopilus funicola TaxID=1934379 RepID=A0AAN6ZR97_9PEZI|nr:hypothetical protein C8A04DRAFT_34098 [Dichotomopilus funicola]